MSHTDKVTIAVVLAVFFGVIVVSVIVATANDRRRMDELWAAARKADKDWSDAMYRYLTSPVEKPRDENE